MKKLFVISILSLSLAATPVSALAASSNAYTNGYNYVIEEDPQYNIPTETLLQQFPITYQTPAETEMSKKIQNRMLNGFYQWNQGFDAWSSNADTFFTAGVQYNLSDENMNLSQYKNAVKSLIDSEQIVRINNLLVSEDWAAIHYWSVVTDTAGNKTADDHMSFLHFVENDGALKVDMAWTK
jgi:hypothetical protein